MIVFPSIAPWWRNFTSSLLPSLNICCTWRKFNIWNQLNMQNLEQDHPMLIGVVKWCWNNMVTWASATLWHTIWVAPNVKSFAFEELWYIHHNHYSTTVVPNEEGSILEFCDQEHMKFTFSKSIIFPCCLSHKLYFPLLLFILCFNFIYLIITIGSFIGVG
jgi:hypothetical protein